MDGGSDCRSALRHPIFWGALALLLINDHVLKGAEVLPGALTGKLSDFAGLIVAPVLVAALFGARRTSTRLLAFALASAPFVAINVSPAAARGMEAMMGLVGVEWRIWCDPTDLVGLAMLPVAFWLLDARPLALPNARATEGALAILAGFACIATSPPPPTEPGTRVIEVPPPDWQTAAYLHNESGWDVDVRLRWADARFDCNRIYEDPGRYLDLAAFGDGVTVTLDPDRNFPLDRAAAGEALEAGTTWLPTRSECDAVLVQRDGSPDAVVYFRPIERVAVPRHGAAVLDRGVEVGRDGDIFGGDGRSVLVSLRDDRPETDAGLCPAADAPPFAYSGERVGRGRVATVTGTELLRDGCFEVSFEAEDEIWSSFVCLPMWAFDLSVGDEVRFDSANPEALFLVRSATAERPATELRLLTSRTGYVGEDSAPMSPSRSDVCLGGTTACGAYAAPAVVELSTGERLHAGEETTGLLEDGRPFRLAIGDARETVVGVDGCAGVEREPGMQINLVMFIEEVE